MELLPGCSRYVNDKGALNMQLTTLYMSLYYKSSVVSYTIFVADQSLTIYVVLRALGETLLNVHVTECYFLLNLHQFEPHTLYELSTMYILSSIYQSMMYRGREIEGRCLH